MFNWIIKWQIVFALIDAGQSTIQIPSNLTLHFSVGFFCLYCGRPDQTHSHFSPIQPKQTIDCAQPYYIFCSATEAVGCVKHIKIIDYHMEMIKDCLRFTELPNLDTQCRPEYPQSSVNINEKAFCCNDAPFCNHSLSSFLRRKKWFLTWFHSFILLIEHYYFISI